MYFDGGEWGREAFNFEKYFLYLQEGKDQGQRVHHRKMFFNLFKLRIFN